MKRTKIKIFAFLLVALLLVVLVFSGCAKPAAPEVFKWRAQEPFGAGDLTTELVFYPMFDTIERMSEGRIAIERFTVGGLVPGEDMLNAVSTGALDLAILPAVFQTGVLGHVAYLEMPMPFASESLEEFYSLFYEHGLLEVLQEVYSPHNIYYLGNLPSAGLVLQTNFPVNSVADVKGRKIRSSGALSALVERMGGAVVGMPPSEMYMAMKLGTIEGFTYSIPELESMGFHEVVDFVVLPPLVANVGTGLIVNMDRWNALPDDLQQKLKKAVAENAIPLGKSYEAAQENTIRTIADVQFNTLPDSEVKELRQIAVSYWDQLATEGPLLAKGVKIIKDYHGMK